MKSLIEEVEQHISDTKLHPDMAGGLRIIATRVEAAFKRLLDEVEDGGFYAHVMNGATHPRDLAKQRREAREVQEQGLMQIEEPSKGGTIRLDTGAVATGVIKADTITTEPDKSTSSTAAGTTSNIAGSTKTAPAESTERKA